MKRDNFQTSNVLAYMPTDSVASNWRKAHAMR